MAPTRGRRKKDYDVVVQGQSAEKVAAEVAARPEMGRGKLVKWMWPPIINPIK